MKNRLFNRVQIRKPGSNLFDLSHEKKLSMNMGQLVPIYTEEVIPGDKFRVRSEFLVKLAPLTAPMMHRVNVYTHFFFVPNRLVYSDWETFITGGEDGKQLPSFPTITFDTATQMAGYLTPGQLPDYFGIPMPPAGTITNELEVSALPFRAYQTIFNEYYRDQNLQTKVPVSKNGSVSDPERTELIHLRYRAWEKDYFTSALPWSQRGGEVSIPSSLSIPADETNQSYIYQDGQLYTPATGENLQVRNDGKLASDTSGLPLQISSGETVNITVNELRKAVRLQEWLEKNARAGSRYIEQILSHFGVRSSDARLQRPEYLGGGKSPVVISEVLSTFNNETVPGAEMYGHGVSAGQNNSFSRSFEEHGYIIGIMSVLPKTAYQQGIEKFWLKKDKFDFFWPEFAQLGEQPILNKEIYHDYMQPAGTDDTFGYQSRYSEYKFKNSSVHGNFRDTLDHWHMGRIFENAPALNTAFVQCDATHRVFADTDPADHKLFVQLYNDVKAVRPMPIFGTPTL